MPLCNTALPAARLAVAVLDSSAAHADIHLAMKVAMQLCQGINEDAKGRRSSVGRTPPNVTLTLNDDANSLGTVTEQLLQSVELLRLLAAAHACSACTAFGVSAAQQRRRRERRQ